MYDKSAIFYISRDLHVNSINFYEREKVIWIYIITRNYFDHTLPLKAPHMILPRAPTCVYPGLIGAIWCMWWLVEYDNKPIGTNIYDTEEYNCYMALSTCWFIVDRLKERDSRWTRGICYVIATTYNLLHCSNKICFVIDRFQTVCNYNVKCVMTSHH